MRFSIRFKKLSFKVSDSIADVIIKNDISLGTKTKTKKNHIVFFLDDSCLPFFQTVKTYSLSHFYVLIFSKRYRICKELYDFLHLKSLKSGCSVTKVSNNGFDKFYTKSSVAQLCVSSFVSNIKIGKKDLIIEPSAGNGNFIKPLKVINCDKIFIDIAPEHELIQRADFLR
jgi:hypothetical protein